MQCNVLIYLQKFRTFSYFIYYLSLLETFVLVNQNYSLTDGLAARICLLVAVYWLVFYIYILFYYCLRISRRFFVDHPLVISSMLFVFDETEEESRQFLVTVILANIFVWQLLIRLSYNRLKEELKNTTTVPIMAGKDTRSLHFPR